MYTCEIYNMYDIALRLQFRELMKREWVCFFRRPEEYQFRVGITVFFCFVVCCIYWNMENDCKHNDVRNRFGMVYLVTHFNLVLTLAVNDLTFPNMRLNIEKERNSSSMYSTLFWSVIRSLITIPPSIVNGILFGLVVFLCLKVNCTFGEWMELTTLSVVCGDAMGVTIGAMASSVSVAFQVE